MKTTQGYRLLAELLRLLSLVALEQRLCLSGVAASHSWRDHFKSRFQTRFLVWRNHVNLARLKASRSLTLSERGLL